METAGLVQGVPSPPRPQLSPPTATAMTTPPLLPFKLDKTPMYSSPPPAASNPENNTCKLIEYRGAKVAAFSVDNRELICLPQAFELFLKHLVGGLHTVYTKLKRLEIMPVVCNVEQVRVLRGLGAIQPGVNRCKLISPKEFDVLYDDCTNSSARPGRPPKRSTAITATPDTLEKLKKSRLENGDFAFAHMHDPKKAALLGNGYHYPPHLAPLPFMPMAHPAMMSMAMASHLGMRQEQMAFHAQEKDYHPHRAAEPKDEQTLEKPQDKPLDLNIKSDDNHNHKRAASIESGTSTSSDILGHHDLTKTGIHLLDDLDDGDSLDDDDDDDLDDSDMSHETPGLSPAKPGSQNLTYAAQLLNASESTQVSSIETLLMNIQGLLKVAVENARHQERQIKYETAELKVEVQKEKDMRSAIEKQLSVETRHRAALQKRLKKERKARRKLQDQLEMILKQRTLPAEDHNNQPIPALHRLSEPINDEPPVLENRVMEQDRNTQAPTPPSMKGYMESILGQTCTSAANGFIHSPTTTSVSAPSVVKAE